MFNFFINGHTLIGKIGLTMRKVYKFTGIRSEAISLCNLWVASDCKGHGHLVLLRRLKLTCGKICVCTIAVYRPFATWHVNLLWFEKFRAFHLASGRPSESDLVHTIKRFLNLSWTLETTNHIAMPIAFTKKAGSPWVVICSNSNTAACLPAANDEIVFTEGKNYLHQWRTKWRQTLATIRSVEGIVPILRTGKGFNISLTVLSVANVATIVRMKACS